MCCEPCERVGSTSPRSTTLSSGKATAVLRSLPGAWPRARPGAGDPRRPRRHDTAPRLILLVALTREPSSSLAAGERTFQTSESIDVEAARLQHRTYRCALAECGAQVVTLPALEEHPDAVFVEDVAIVLDEMAILLPMGVDSRSKEPEQIAAEPGRWREVVRLPEGSRAEGGDVVRLGRTLYVGRSGRSDDSGIAALSAATGTGISGGSR